MCVSACCLVINVKNKDLTPQTVHTESRFMLSKTEKIVIWSMLFILYLHVYMGIFEQPAKFTFIHVLSKQKKKSLQSVEVGFMETNIFRQTVCR